MRLARLLTALALAATAAVACDSTTSPQDLTVSDVVGGWTATKIEYALLSDTTRKFDAVANGVASLTITVQENGTFSFTFTQLGVPVSGTASLTVSNGVATITGAGDIDGSYDITAYDESTLSMEDSLVDFDFPNPLPDGVDDDCSVRVVLARQ